MPQLFIQYINMSEKSVLHNVKHEIIDGVLCSLQTGISADSRERVATNREGWEKGQ
jgi:hypothetical protein